jgi:hypothetical protein
MSIARHGHDRIPHSEILPTRRSATSVPGTKFVEKRQARFNAFDEVPFANP